MKISKSALHTWDSQDKANGSSTYEPSPSTSSHSYPHTPHSRASSPLYAVWSPSVSADPPTYPVQSPPSHSRSAVNLLIADYSCPACPSHSATAAAAPTAGRAGSTGHHRPCSGSRRGQICRWRGTSACACKSQCRTHGSGCGG